MSFDDAELRALSASMLERGCLVPVIVQATGDGDYRLVDGEKRYKAAVLAALMELPAIVRPVDAGDDTAELEAELLVDAVVANQLRSQLTLVEEALACRRLKAEHGLTIKGIAQKLQMTQARVRERLAILELPEALWPRIAAGEIPVGAIARAAGAGEDPPRAARGRRHARARPRRRLRRRAVDVARRRRGPAAASSPAACTTRPSTRPPACSCRAAATR